MVYNTQNLYASLFAPSVELGQSCFIFNGYTEMKQTYLMGLYWRCIWTYFEEGQIVGMPPPLKKSIRRRCPTCSNPRSKSKTRPSAEDLAPLKPHG